MPYVHRKDITIYEETELSYFTTTTSYWVANLDGELSTGETVRLGRTGLSALSASANLEAAIAEQGWDLRA